MRSKPEGRPLRDSVDVGEAAELVTWALDLAYYQWQPGCESLYVSPAMQALLDGAPDVWTMQRWLDAIHPNERADYDAARIAFMRDGAERTSFSFRTRIADGSYRWLREQAAAERDAAGGITRLVGVLSDITEAKQRETENRTLIARQSASEDVLRAISDSLDDAQPVFALIARHARTLCGAGAVLVVEFDGTLLHMRALAGGDAAMRARLTAAYPRTPAPDFITGRAVLTDDLVHIRNMPDEPELLPFVHAVGEPSALGVPMRRAGQVVGAMVLSRSAPGGFDDGEVALIRSFAEQAAIALGSAATLAELRARTAELAQRNTEFGERIEQQSATIDVLKAMSRSPDATQAVFDLITRRARELCNGALVGLFEFDGEFVHLRSSSGMLDHHSMKAHYPMRLTRETVSNRAILERRIIHIRDAGNDSELSQTVLDSGSRSILSIPLMRDGTAIGAMSLNGLEPGGFSDGQVSLLQTFAEQAVIAIGSAEIYRELRQRTEALARRNSEYGERIEHQSATIDVLQAMSASAGDPQPVFDLIVRHALQACNGMSAALFEFDGELVHARADAGGDSVAVRAFHAMFPRPPSSDFLGGRVILERQTIHVRDIDSEPGLLPTVRAMGGRTTLSMPILRDGVALGAISLNAPEPGGFSDSQVELLRTFAEQAAIAITTTRTYRALRERTDELARRNSAYSDQVAHQAATIDVLKVMSASRSDTKPVFDTILRRAMDLSGCAYGTVYEFDGELIHLRAGQGFEPEAFAAFARRYPKVPTGTNFAERAVMDRQTYHVLDLDAALPDRPLESRGLSHKAVLAVPLLRGDTAIGVIVAMHREMNRFTEAHIELLKTFAEQAVIAIDGTATFRALQERTEALGQRNEQQAATIEVLKVMSGSLGDAQPVFDLIVRRAAEFCGASGGRLVEFDGELLHLRALVRADGTEAEVEQSIRGRYPALPDPDGISDRVVLNGGIVHARSPGELLSSAPALYSGSVLGVPLLREGRAIGAIVLSRAQEGGFSANQVELLQTFAEQAVIAIGSAKTYRELQNRTEALTRSLNELQALEEVLRAVNSSLDLETVLSTIISRAVQLSRSDEGTIYEFDANAQVFVPRSAFGMSEERVALLRDRRIRLGETHLGRSAVLRVPVAVDDVQNDPSVPNAADALPGIHAVLAVPLLRDAAVAGGLVIRRRSQQGFAPNLVTLMQTFAGQAVLAIENARLFQEARQARIAAETTLNDLRRAQDRLVQSEKMASLGQLTAGIAHEIKNPLNFVNNFSDLSVDLLNELNEAVAPGKLSVAAELRAEIDDITTTLKGNLEKIAQHGRRADSIVKNMLLHARTGPSEHRATDVNATVEEALNLAYHGARAEIPGFNITLEKHFDPAAGMIDAYPQEFTRVLLNLMSNGFYAARKRLATAPPGFEPTLTVTTSDLGDSVEVRVRDNGTGIPPEMREKIFEPFYTTKPAGEGTGLGLSLSYDIVVKQHGGQLAVDSEAGEFTEFVITLPRKIAPTEGSRA